MEAAAKIDTPERQDAMRQVLFETFCQQYHSLANFIQKLPFNQEMKNKVAFFMDTAFLWTKESFVLADVESRRAKIAEVKAEKPAEAPVADVANVAAVTDFADAPLPNE